MDVWRKQGPIVARHSALSASWFRVLYGLFSAIVRGSNSDSMSIICGRSNWLGGGVRHYYYDVLLCRASPGGVMEGQDDA